MYYLKLTTIIFLICFCYILFISPLSILVSSEQQCLCNLSSMSNLSSMNSLQLNLEKHIFRLGDTIEVKISNQGNETLRFNGPSFGIIVKNATGDKIRRGGVFIPTITSLEPGEFEKIPISINLPGTYTVESHTSFGKELSACVKFLVTSNE